MNDDTQNLEIQAEWDLLKILFPNDPLYPWNPYTPEAEAYFLQAEATNSVVEAFTETELIERSQQFMSQMDQLWSATPLQTSLLQRFAEQIPDELLNHLAQVATRITKQVSLRSLSLGDQLVHCVQELLPQWSEEDLQVLARPFAYAMRGAEPDGVELSGATGESMSWSELSEIEQARTCLAIARYALLEVLSDPETC
ncbi:conserved hypothetical protein [Planktothrix serta PCC 8927]|uniref:Uncharacterized protein n=1 Tax=Planktothrix serta PCC 8927 TaxID=671068 RepID=A0A7Z9BN32_9CYAN|nr:hypothetical protein [Planktothrix serta]VXD16067.1 conserved hypothetical protein [Planktothrix serta PCC 8927]